MIRSLRRAVAAPVRPILVAAAAAAGAAACGGSAPDAPRVRVTVPAGASFAAVTDSLVARGVV
ncbi:MAG TPA: hypothetical protein VNK43_03675, partial [Gemmatimonadales bacterium]|nr:hypothetical protein [Gemmatimonadales bacterium]